MAPGVARVPEVALPGMSLLPPGRFADQLRNWAKESVALAALGVTGWSMRFAVTEVAAAHLGGGRTSAASLRKAFGALAAGRFTVEGRVLFAGVHGAEQENDRERTTLILVRLTALGREVLQACGVAAAPAEWEQLLAADLAHIGLACAFAYHARRRGYVTWGGPPGDEGLRGDVRVQLVEAGTSSPQEDLVVEIAGAGRSAVERDACRRRQLVVEAQAAGAAHGVAADLQTLLDAQDKGGALWSETW